MHSLFGLFSLIWFCFPKTKAESVIVGKNCELSFGVSSENVFNQFIKVREMMNRGISTVIFMQSRVNKHCKYALKCFNETNFDEKDFDEEVKITAALSPYAYFPKFYGSLKMKDSCGRKSGIIFTEIIEGKDLFDAAIKYLTTCQLHSIFTEIAEIIQFLHFKSIIHADIKPENIMILPNGRVKVIDFGHSLQVSDLCEIQTGVVGTAYYLPSSRRKFNYLNDWFAYGVTLLKVFELMSSEERFGDTREILKFYNENKLFDVILACTDETSITDRISSLEELKKYDFFQDRVPEKKLTIISGSTILKPNVCNPKNLCR